MIRLLQQKFPALGFCPNEPLASHTTFRIGGLARAWVAVSSETLLVDLLGLAAEMNLSHVLVGGGSNLLCDSAGFDGLVIANHVRWARSAGEDIECSAGLELQELVRFALDRGLAGLEFASGIPGSTGGALAGNAGAYGSNLGAIAQSARILSRSGEIRTVGADYFKFAYRRSQVQITGETILSAHIRLAYASDVMASRARSAEILAERARKHPGAELPSAGSYFKNLDRFDESGRRIAAGLLLDQAGCKGLRIGGAQVYEKHANIIVNRGGATSDHVLALAAAMRKRVFEAFGVELQPEVRYIPARASASNP